ncbi:hypothetical protein [Streptomyces sp. NRRL S-1824]|uniref:hypothetical protein n=1 Tax=Streptomyces sp. NRRL S-1824 TaxID=1463889 RepID=UPI00131CF135|nr:hypothetical protein [Streptomyces sp. NRRL S-1824]
MHGHPTVMPIRGSSEILVRRKALVGPLRDVGEQVSDGPVVGKANRTGDAQADAYANTGVHIGDVTVNVGPESVVRFAHIGIPFHTKPRWAEYPHRTDFLGCEFTEPCDRLFSLTKLIYDADLFFDVVLLNMGDSPAVISKVGIWIEEVQQLIYLYGYPKASKISPATDEYMIIMPDLQRRYNVGLMDHMVPDRVEVRAAHELVDPLYLPPKGLYRYILHLKSYQKNMPNHAQIRLTAEVNGEEVHSPKLHVFTR